MPTKNNKKKSRKGKAAIFDDLDSNNSQVSITNDENIDKNMDQNILNESEEKFYDAQESLEEQFTDRTDHSVGISQRNSSETESNNILTELTALTISSNDSLEHEKTSSLLVSNKSSESDDFDDFVAATSNKKDNPRFDLSGKSTKEILEIIKQNIQIPQTNVDVGSGKELIKKFSQIGQEYCYLMEQEHMKRIKDLAPFDEILYKKKVTKFLEERNNK